MDFVIGKQKAFRFKSKPEVGQAAAGLGQTSTNQFSSYPIFSGEELE